MSTNEKTDAMSLCLSRNKQIYKYSLEMSYAPNCWFKPCVEPCISYFYMHSVVSNVRFYKALNVIGCCHVHPWVFAEFVLSLVCVFVSMWLKQSLPYFTCCAIKISRLCFFVLCSFSSVHIFCENQTDVSDSIQKHHILESRFNNLLGIT